MSAAKTAGKLFLRSYQPGDFEALYQIDQSCYPPGIAYSRRMLKWYLGLPGAECVVAEHDAALVGFVLTARDAAQGHVITLDVLLEHRRRGIGSALLAEAELRLCDAGVRQVTLETATDNRPAVAFWHKHGYRTRGILKGYYLGRVDAYWMEKFLAAVPGRSGSPAAERNRAV